MNSSLLLLDEEEPYTNSSAEDQDLDQDLDQDQDLLLPPPWEEEEWSNLYRHSNTVNVILIGAYLLILTLGVVGNLMVVGVVLRSPRMRTVTNLFILNLAIADLLVVLFCLPPTLVSNILVRKCIFAFPSQ